MILLSLLFVLHSPLHAQERVDTTKSYAISEISVVGNRTTKEVTPVQTLTGRALQRLNAHSVADAVRYFSGVQIKDYG
ncbi:MAG: TonB-dependent receptor, partial [Alistipes sp.]